MQAAPSPPPRKCRQVTLRIAQSLYYCHLVLSLLACIALLILQPRLRSGPSLTLALTLVYGFMLAWLLLLNLLFVSINKQSHAVWCNRMVAKLLLMLAPAFVFMAYQHEHFLSLQSVTIFMIYLCVMSALLTVYQCYSCTWGHHEEPNFLYQHNDLTQHVDEVWRVRRDYYEGGVGYK